MSIEKKDDNYLILKGRIDSSSLNVLEPLIEEINSDITINLEEVEYINSAGLGVFLAIEQNARKRGDSASVTIEKPTKYIEELFKITGLDKLLRISTGE